MKASFLTAALPLGSLAGQAQQSPNYFGNPLFPRRYADSEAAIFSTQHWIYPTCSALFDPQVYHGTRSSPDLVT